LIAAGEVIRRARDWQADPAVVELDYVLGCFLSHWFRLPIAEKTLFKGGTCLRKCYFPDYRFSEDVDLTALDDIEADELREGLDEVAREVARSTGVNMAAQPTRVEVVRTNSVSTYIEGRLYFQGPLQRTGSPQGIRIDVSSGEAMAFSAVPRELSHPYTDAQDLDLGKNLVPCYDLREVLLEKLRGVSGQRRYAIARDLFDIDYLLQRADVQLEEAIPFAEAKFAAKGLEISRQTLENLEARKDAFRLDWARGVERLVPTDQLTEFDAAWNTVVLSISAIVEAHNG